MIQKIMHVSNYLSLCFVHANDKSKLTPNCTNLVRDVPGCALASHLTTLKEIGASRLYKRVKKWCSQGQKGFLSYRFTGKETKNVYSKGNFAWGWQSSATAPIRTFAFIGLQLRDAISRIHRVTITEGVLQEIKDSCKRYFNVCYLLLHSVTPTVWTIGHAIPYHTNLLYRKLGLG